MLSISLKIKIEMLKKGVTGGQIARKLGITRASISFVINGKTRSHRIRRTICEATGLPWSIWEELDREINKEKEVA